MKEIKKVTVKYNDQIVGYLAMLQNQKIYFQYADTWLQNGFSISPFSLPLDNEIHIAPSNNFDGLFGVFQDSLPDGWGELLIRRKLSNQGINYDKLSPLQKLYLSNSSLGLGALTYIPSFQDEAIDQDIDLDIIAQASQQIYDNESTNNLDEICRRGGSSGGARPKVHIIDENNDYWIVKFRCKEDPINIGEEEYNINLLAKKCGLNVNECKLFPSKICKGHYGAKRFDRENNKKIHMISLSSLLETSHRTPNLDYKILLQVIKAICNDQDQLYEGFRRMCFNFFIKNKDDHGKNFSFLYDEVKNSYTLSPAYDLTSTPNKWGHEMAINGKDEAAKGDLIEVAKSAGLNIDKCQTIIDEIETIIKNKTGFRN